MESYLPISFLNDFIFCPRSIYFHQLYKKVSTRLYHDKPQTQGLVAHKTIDQRTYSTSKHVLQGIEIYSERYRIFGKLDTFNSKTGELTERKKKIKTIYPGYIFQVYAQYFCLLEMGYVVNKMRFHSLDDNKNYSIDMPYDNNELLEDFNRLVEDMHKFDLTKPFHANPNKCQNCIYNNLCDEVSLC